MSTLSGTGQLSLNFLYWGFVVATVLLGVTVIQGFIYFRNYDDTRPLRLLVSTLVALDLLSSALMAHVIYYYMIQSYGNEASLATPPPVTFPTEYLTTAVITFLSQMFYASQIYKLRKHSHRCMVPLVTMIFLAVFAFLSNIVASILIITLNYSSVSFSVQILKTCTSIGNCFAAASDVIACTALCFFLSSHRTDIVRSRVSLIDTLMFYTVNRGVLFSIVQLGHMIAYISAPTMLYWVPFHLCLSKLYVNSLLALLNSRKALRGAVQDISRIDFHIDPPATLPPAVQKSRTSFVGLRRFEVSSSGSDEAKCKTPAPKRPATGRRIE